MRVMRLVRLVLGSCAGHNGRHEFSLPMRFIIDAMCGLEAVW